MLLGEPEKVQAYGSLAPNGVDADAELLFDYPRRTRLAQVLPVQYSSEGSYGRRHDGNIELTENFYSPTVLKILRHGQELETHQIKLDGHGYTYEIRKVLERISGGDLESPEMSHQDSVAVVRTVCKARDLVLRTPSRN